jgi:transcriptional regulator with XRE-family HTH domain
MIDVAQLRAARALLNCKISDLTEKSGVLINTISSIEREKTQPRRDTMEKIQKAFEDSGVEFLPGSGVRKKNNIVLVYEDPDANKLLVEDFYHTLRDTGGEILIAHLVEGEALAGLGSDFIKDQIEKRKAANITHRMLVRASDPNLIPPLDTYHVLPDEYFSSYPFYVYGSKLALFCRHPSPKVIIVNDERFTESVRKLFNFVWDRTAMPHGK